MSTVSEQPKSELASQQPKTMAAAILSGEKKIAYMPLGSKVEIELTFGMVRKFLCKPTKNGVWPGEADIVKFMMLCKSRELDPWSGDAWLTGYDGKDGPEFSLITAQQAFLKRAEVSPEFNGIESGVIIKNAEGTIEFREGDITYDKEILLGAWSKVYRKDREKVFYDALKFSTYDKGYSRWKADPAGMIVKCAESSTLRKAFPTQLGGLYTAAEMQYISQERIDNRTATNSLNAPPTTIEGITKALKDQQKDKTEPVRNVEFQGDHIEEINQERQDENEFAEKLDKKKGRSKSAEPFTGDPKGETDEERKEREAEAKQGEMFESGEQYQ